MGTVAETVMIMTLFGQSWDKWDLSFKVVTPILHVLFTIAQLHAARILLAMWAKQKAAVAEEEERYMDVEAGSRKQKAFASGAEGGPPRPDEPAFAENPEAVTPPTTGDTSLRPEPAPRRKRSLLASVDRFFTGR
jgi:hypothetical protein